jgi:hypothetical protein
MAGTAAAAANVASAGVPAGHMRPNSSSSSIASPGQRPAGPFSPLFSGGGMWSSQGLDKSQTQDPTRNPGPDYVSTHASPAPRQQAASAPPGSRNSSMLGASTPAVSAHAVPNGRRAVAMPADMYEGYEGGLGTLDEVPRSRPTTSSTMRTNKSGRQTPPASRGNFSSAHSVLSAGSYQAAAAAAAAAVVAANARNRGLSPGRGGTIQDVERNYVAAAANAAVTRCAVLCCSVLCCAVLVD